MELISRMGYKETYSSSYAMTEYNIEDVTKSSDVKVTECNIK